MGNKNPKETQWEKELTRSVDKMMDMNNLPPDKQEYMDRKNEEFAARYGLPAVALVPYEWGKGENYPFKMVNPKKRKPRAVKVGAEVVGDDGGVALRISSCVAWLNSLSPAEVRKLRKKGWGNCEVADELAYWLENQGGNTGDTASEMVESYEGFEVKLDKKAAERWYKYKTKKKVAVKSYLAGKKKEKAAWAAQKKEAKRVQQALADETKREKRKLAFATVLHVKRTQMTDFEL